MTVYTVRAVMVDGGVVDLLQFVQERDALQYRDSIQQSCRLLGWDSISVVPRRVIGREPLERRTPKHRARRNKLIAAAAAVMALSSMFACTDTPTSPSAPHDVICPTGCPIPPGCIAVLSPPNNPIGYKLICDQPTR